MKRLRALIVEDTPDDFELAVLELKRAAFDVQPERHDTLSGTRTALENKAWDVVLCDHSLPGFSPHEVLAALKEFELDTPLLVVSGAIGEEQAVRLMHEGAADFISKNRLERLGVAVSRAIQSADARRARARMERELARANAELESRVEQRTKELKELNAHLQEQIASRERIERQLRYRDEVLEAVAYAADRFLRERSWRSSMPRVLARLGSASGVSRVYVFENHEPTADTSDAGIVTSQRYEWTAVGVAPLIADASLQGFRYESAGFGRWVRELRKGTVIEGRVDDFPEEERGFLRDQDIRSIVAVPIFTNDRWWGFLGFDDCANARVWSRLELEALEVAADTLGAAIERENIEQELQGVLLRLADVREQERAQLSRYLHDASVQDLLGLSYIIADVQRRLRKLESVPDTLHEAIERTRREVLRVSQDLRGVLSELRPVGLDELGLRESLEAYLESLRSRYGDKLPNVELHVDGLEYLDAPTALCMHRAVQEGVRNAMKHAGASNVVVVARRRAEAVELTLSDDGRGFDLPGRLGELALQDHYGLVTLDEQARALGGALTVRSSPGEGTTLSLALPVEGKETRDAAFAAAGAEP